MEKKYLSSLDYDVQAIWIVDKDSDVLSDLETKDYKIITTDKIKKQSNSCRLELLFSFTY